jgi:hypothetical protein
MIQAHELRKGNCVNLNGSSYYVSQIMWNELETMRVSGKDKTYIKCSYVEVEPIPLTPEILMNCGFIRQERFHYSQVFTSKEGNFIINQLRDSCEISYGLDGNLAIISKREVGLHQLQNLYFALTAKELEVKL